MESGRIDPDDRGRSRAYERFAVPVPRDGGIRELLDAATRSGRHFDGVICESIDRVARRTYYGVKIEHDLERAGLPLLAAGIVVFASPMSSPSPRGDERKAVISDAVNALVDGGAEY